MNGKLLFIHGITPIHTGTGQSVDVIDLPVAREKTTNWPYIPGSSIKGVLRDAFKDKLGENFVNAVFGSDKVETDTAQAGTVIFADAKLLCFPVRSFYGTFCWATCPSALSRLRRDYLYSHPGMKPPFDKLPSIIHGNMAMVCSETNICQKDKIYLEDLDFLKMTEQSADDWANAIAQVLSEDAEERDAFKRRFVILNDDLFTMLTETATEVTARIRIEENKKTVQQGGLWYEEAVPSETIFWLPLLDAARNGAVNFKQLQDNFIEYAQIGGNATVGRGIVRFCLGKEN